MHRPARVPMGTFSRSAILHHFPNFYTLKVEIFRMFFIRSHLPMTPMNHEKFNGNRSARFSKIRLTDRQTHTQMRQLYVYRRQYSKIQYGTDSHSPQYLPSATYVITTDRQMHTAFSSLITGHCRLLSLIHGTLCLSKSVFKARLKLSCTHFPSHVPQQ